MVLGPPEGAREFGSVLFLMMGQTEDEARARVEVWLRTNLPQVEAEHGIVEWLAGPTPQVGVGIEGSASLVCGWWGIGRTEQT